MRRSHRRDRRSWLLDGFLFAVALIALGCVTVSLAVSSRVFGDGGLMALAVLSLIPAFWLFYRRAVATRTANGSPPSRGR